jgi:tyrosyl-DNA phosphodiesterase 2
LPVHQFQEVIEKQLGYFTSCGMLATGKEKISVASTSASAIQSKTTKAAEGPWLRNCSTQVVILSYNVWFREDLQLEGRMEAIGELILQHQPHIICFQVPFLHHMICFQEFL